MIRAFAIAVAVAALSGCDPTPAQSVPAPPPPVDMDGDWGGTVTVYAVAEDGSKTKAYEYETTIALQQDGNWAVARGICPSEVLEVDNIFINRTFLYWEGTEWCATPPAPITYLALVGIHIEPQPDGTGRGYVRGAFAVDKERTLVKMWAELSLRRTTRGQPAIGRWDGMFTTTADGEVTDSRPGTVIVTRESAGLRVDGMCPRGDGSLLVDDAGPQLAWGETRCASPWATGEEPTLILDSATFEATGDEAVMRMTGALAAPGTIPRAATVSFTARRAAY